MPLDPQALALRTRNETAGATPLYEMTVEDARRADLAAIRANAATPEPVAEVVDTEIPGPGGPLPLRIYRPAGAGPFPVLLYLFGGGWTLGCLDTADGICRDLTNAAGCITVSVEYRLAPEHKFPAAVDDSYHALTWIAEHATEFSGDPTRLAVGGDSAGGNLAAAITLLARDRGGPALSFQLLAYPNTDYLADTPSRRENTDRYLFNSRSVAWYWDNYLACPEDGANPLASPLRAGSHSGLPPALVITAEYDPLRDEGEQYARKLVEAGVPVTVTQYEGMVHGFFAMTRTLAAGKRAMTQAADLLRAALNGRL
ncbi:alpha/beta hydrolase [Actinokineospora sp.]|uniref:alpha/beta hydrolase n=1 Tax=Actinokineospora sp. TaxID=1872133 RepID=UPI00403829B9